MTQENCEKINSRLPEFDCLFNVLRDLDFPYMIKAFPSTCCCFFFSSKTTLERFAANETFVGKVCYITPSLRVSGVNFFAMLMHVSKVWHL